MSGLDILMPHYEDPKGLALSLGSIAAQTWPGDMRIVIVDDGSSPHQFRAVEALAAKQKLPVELLRNPENRGRPFTRNRLLDSVASPYVAWLDVGDVWYPTKLERQFEQVNRRRFAGDRIDNVWITCHYDWQLSGEKSRLKRQEAQGDQLRDLMLGERLRAYLWTVLGSAAAFKAVGRFDEQLPRLQDLDYFIRFVRGGGVIVTPPVGEALCKHHESDLGRDAVQLRACNRLIVEKNRAEFQKYGRQFVAQIDYNAEILSARFAKNNGQTAVWSYYLTRSMLADPQRTSTLARRWLRGVFR